MSARRAGPFTSCRASVVKLREKWGSYKSFANKNLFQTIKISILRNCLVTSTEETFYMKEELVTKTYNDKTFKLFLIFEALCNNETAPSASVTPEQY